MERLFKTGDNNSNNAGIDIATPTNAYDIDWDLQKYSVTTGWRIPAAATTAPASQDFPAVNVDFGRFIMAPETYNSAVSGLTVAGTVLATAVLAMAF